MKSRNEGSVQSRIVFPVNRARVFRKVFWYMLIAIYATIALALLVNFVKSGFRVDQIFKHVGFINALFLALFWVPIGIGFFAGLISLLSGMSGVLIEGRFIFGRNNLWGKRSFPLSDIVEVIPFERDGLSYIVIKSRHSGKLYVSTEVE